MKSNQENGNKMEIETEVLIVGGGPAGSLLSVLLARAGVQTILVEKQSNVDRAFRGETIAARSVQTLRRLGLGPELDEHGFLEMTGVSLWENNKKRLHCDYRKFKIDALPIDIPQPALLRILTQEASRFPNFTLMTGTTCTSLLSESEIVRGAVIRTAQGETKQIRARLVVGADGRSSRVRRAAKIAAKKIPLARDFLWFKLSRPQTWPSDGELHVRDDKHLVILPTFPDLLRIGCNLPKGSLASVREAGIDAFKQEVLRLNPRLEPMIDEVTCWADTSYLEIFTANSQTFAKNGLLLVGDAAQTCSPILGQGVNLAIQDAVLAAPAIVEGLARCKGEAVRYDIFSEYIKQRASHRNMVVRFQRAQEASLCQSGRWETSVRRARWALLNNNPIKHRLLDKLMNGPDLGVRETHVAA